jgi:hypothetical protein
MTFTPINPLEAISDTGVSVKVTRHRLTYKVRDRTLGIEAEPAVGTAPIDAKIEGQP